MAWADVLFSLPLKDLGCFGWGSDAVLPKLHHSESLFLLKEAGEQDGEERIVMAGSW